MNFHRPPRAIAYTSSAHLCGIADYHGRLAPHLPAVATTLPLPSNRVLRDRPLALLEQRCHYRKLAAAADSYDVALLQMVTHWNAFRVGEYLLPTFLRRLRAPLVVVMHEWLDGIGNEPARSGLLGHVHRLAIDAFRRFDFDGLAFERWFQQVFLPRVSHFIVHAEHLADQLSRAGVASERITFCIQPTYPIAGQPDESALVDVPPNKRLVVLFGFPHPRKRYDIALRALSMLPADVMVMMVGEAEDEFRRAYVNELRQLASQIGVADRFMVMGEMPSTAVASIFSRADVAVAPVGYATGSAALGYLIAAGLPIVASDVPSIRAVCDAGAGMALFEAGNVTACADTLRYVLGDRDVQATLRRRNTQFAGVHTFAKLGEMIDHRLQEAAGQSSAVVKTRHIAQAGAHS
jgi:glycosyltransferase involved in cell wall biosynthesis